MIEQTLTPAGSGEKDAPVLVLSHSLGAGPAIWEPQIADLGRHFPLLRYTTLGHGASPDQASEYSLADLGHQVLNLLDAHSIATAHFCGVSLGGLTGLWLGIHAPHRLRSLIAVDTAARIGTRASWEARIDQVRSHGLASIVDGTLERWFTAAFRAAHPGQVEATRRLFLSTPVEGYAACCAALRDSDLTGAVSAIAVPTLVLTGQADPVTPPADGQFLAQRVAGARFGELQGAHLAHVEDAAAFNRAVTEYVLAIEQDRKSAMLIDR